MSALDDRLLIRPVGVVRNGFAEPHEMPRGGVPSRLDILPEFAAALDGIERASHLIVVAWLHRADRTSLRVRPRGEPAAALRGVFVTRSPSRPNPIGLATVRFLGRDGATVDVGALDFVDGTPIADLKPYSTGFDGAFCARSPRDLSRDLGAEEREAPRLIHEAELFHGERCAAVVAAARLVYDRRRAWGVAEKDPRLRLSPGDDGCFADALQAITGARFGDGRLLRRTGDRSFRLTAEGVGAVVVSPRPWPAAEEAMAVPLEALLEVTET